MCVINRSVARHLLPRIWSHEAARNASVGYLHAQGTVSGIVASETAFLKAWNDVRQKRSTEYNEWFEHFAAVAASSLNATTSEVIASNLATLRAEWLPSIDAARLTRLVAMIRGSRSVFLPIHFGERERSYQSSLTQIESLKHDIEDNPTRFAVGAMYPLLEAIRAQVQTAWDDVLATTQPLVTVDLALDQVTPAPSGTALLQLRISNDRGSQPIVGVSVALSADVGECVPSRERFEYSDVIQGDDSAIIECVVIFSPEAILARAVSVAATVRYRNRSGEEVQVAAQKVSVRLYAPTEFVPIDPNPYAPYTESGPVKDVHMFYGREADLANIANAVQIATSKCVVIYGQKRAGKSSVLYHLHTRLNSSDNVIAVSLSLGAVVAEFSLAALFYRMASRLSETLDRMRRDGRIVPDLTEVHYADFSGNATIAFTEFLRRYHRSASDTPGWGGRRLVFLIDEFTYLYTAIRTQRISADVMKTWKALLEDGQFSAVLVGQDVMRQFMHEFRNEFGIAQPIRLSYLPEIECDKLLEVPILANGESRYRGKALRRARELVSGSAYYAQMFGNRLVEYMNSVRATYVTEADVDKVARRMVEGQESLDIDKFDNLLTAGDAATDTYSPDAVLRIVAAIARGSRAGLCSRQSLIDEGIAELDGLLLDLVWRGVVDEPQHGFFRLHVGLFSDWLVARYGVLTEARAAATTHLA